MFCRSGVAERGVEILLAPEAEVGGAGGAVDEEVGGMLDGVGVFFVGDFRVGVAGGAVLGHVLEAEAREGPAVGLVLLGVFGFVDEGLDEGGVGEGREGGRGGELVVVWDVDVAVEGDGVIFTEVKEFAQVVVDAEVLLEGEVAVDGVEEEHLVAGDAEAGAGVALADGGGGGKVAGYGVVGKDAAELAGGGFGEFVDDGGRAGNDFLDDVDCVFDAVSFETAASFLDGCVDLSDRL